MLNPAFFEDEEEELRKKKVNPYVQVPVNPLAQMEYHAGESDPSEYLGEDEDLAELRSKYRQRMGRALAMKGENNTIPRAAGGLMDALALGQQGDALSAGILTGRNIQPMAIPGAAAEVDRSIASRREKALGDVQMFKTLEDLAQKRKDAKLKLHQQNLDRESKNLYYKASLGDRAAQRELMALLAGKKMEFEGAEKSADREFKAEEGQKERDNKVVIAGKKASKGGGAGKSAMEKLSGDQKSRVGAISDAMRSLNEYETAYNAGGRRSRINPDTRFIGGFVSASKIDELTTKLSDDIGRMRSGGAIGGSEEQRFLGMLPTSADNPTSAMSKINSLRKEFQNKLYIFGIKEPDLAKAGVDIGSVTAPKKKMSFEEWKKAGKPK